MTLNGFCQIFFEFQKFYQGKVANSSPESMWVFSTSFTCFYSGLSCLRFSAALSIRLVVTQEFRVEIDDEQGAEPRPQLSFWKRVNCWRP